MSQTKKKLFFAHLTALMCVICAIGLVACDRGGTHTHSYGDWPEVKAATRTEEGMRSRECGHVQMETIPQIPHTYDSDNKCTVCGDVLKYTVCLKYTEIKVNTTTAYEVAGLGTATDTDILIPVYHEGKPVISIGSYAFEECRSLMSVNIPHTVTSIDFSAFIFCSELMEIKVENGNSKYHSAGNCLIETESKTLIAGCKNSIIPTDGSITSIGNYAFEECRSLTSVAIPNSVMSISGYEFVGCRSLASVTIPDSIMGIGECAFSDCVILTDIYFEGAYVQWQAIEKGYAWGLMKVNIPFIAQTGTIDKFIS